MGIAYLAGRWWCSWSRSVALLEDARASGDPRFWSGGAGAFSVVGDLNGTTATLQTSWNGFDWLPVGAETTFAEPGIGLFRLPASLLRVTVSGGTPVSVTAFARHL